MIRRQLARIAGVLALAAAAALLTTGSAQACPAWGIETVIGPTSAYGDAPIFPKHMFCDDGD